MTMADKVDPKKVLAALKKKGSLLKKAGNVKDEGNTGYTTNEDIIKVFKLKVGSQVRVNARVSRGRVGLDKNGKLFASVNFVCVGSLGKGQTPSKYINLTTKEGDDNEDGYNDLSKTLQRLGVKTANMSPEGLMAAMDTLTKDKPYASITIKRWGDGDGLNIYVNNLIDESDLDEEEESVDDTEDEDESESEEDDDASDEEDEEGDDEEAEDSDDDEGDEEEDDDGPDSKDPSTWIGCKVTFKTKEMPRAAKGTVSSYNAKTKTLKIKKSNGDIMTAKSSDVAELDGLELE